MLRVQRLAFFSASLATGAAVSIGGPIGFVGIVVPHLVRLLVGADHRLVVPASLGFGAAFLVGCDLVVAHRHRADRAAGRHRHGAHRGAVLPLAPDSECMMSTIDATCVTSHEGCDRSADSAEARRLEGSRSARDLVRPRWSRRGLGGDRRDAGAAARIVSLVPAATEMLFAIGAGPRVVAVSSYDHEPPEVDRLPRVGALLDPDLERILGLRPDLVVIYGTQHDLQQQLLARGDSRPSRTHTAGSPT